jgi:hypothetical protein
MHGVVTDLDRSGGTAAARVAATAAGIAEEVLFPAALATDSAEIVPLELLDVLVGGGVGVASTVGSQVAA